MFSCSDRRSMYVLCVGDYQLVGVSDLTCLDTGGWSGESPTCELTQSGCPPLSAPENGELSGFCSSAVTGDRCMFSCLEEYQLVGDSELICLESGSWSGTTPICNITEPGCPTLRAPENGELSGFCSSAVTGDRCTFSCLQDYQLIGDSELICLESGSWSGTTPTCNIQQSYCPAITAPENGEIAGICSAAVTGDRCTFSCVGDYQLVGVSDLTCLDTGGWSGESPTCELTQSGCPPLSAPENGELSGFCSSAVTGDRCMFSCLEEYQLVGDSELICLESGSWSGTTPICNITEPGCPTLSAPENGELSGFCSSAVTGDRCTFSCLQDYQLIGDSELICLESGSWSGTTPTCNIQQSYCPVITAPENGEIAGICSAAVTGDRCTFSCVGDYQLVGVADLTCLDTGSWSGESPTCELTQSGCPPLSGPENGELSGFCSSAVTGDRCMFSCLEEYQLVGDSELICLESGSWSGTTPICNITKAGCPTLSAPENGELSGFCSSAVTGDRCTFSCLQDYQLIGDSELICLESGSWSGTTPTCNIQQSYCPAITAPENGEIAGICSAAVTGDRCTFSCVGDYQLVGVSDLTCLDTGSWSGESPTCELTESGCPTLSAPENGELSGLCSSAVTGDRCTFSCLENYQLVGDSELICLESGSWSGTTPTCNIQQSYCPTITAPENGEIAGSCSSAVTGDRCAFSCVGNYQLVGLSDLTCLDTGNWSGERPSCELQQTNCPTITAPENGEIAGMCSSAVTGDRCTFSCEGEYQLVGVSDLTCLDTGSWSGESPSCELQQSYCPTITAPENGEIAGSCSSAVTGDRCAFSCLGNYQLVGLSDLTCLDTGNWSGESPSCELQQSYCPTLSAPENGEIAGNCSSSVTGDKCTFSCIETTN
ncbi:P-selectin-like isoform X3 [Tachypleus tridentatus]|uniref:P-selectin-like isoform X3 n=1 Tax=Tachypleus tridentatus TaxID=6853 RepID=UPI003FD3481C